MKKLLGLVSSLALIAACSSPQTNQNAVVSSPAKAVETKPTSAVSQAEIEVREKATWEALVKKDYAAFADMLAADYLEITENGILDKAALVSNLKDLNTSETTFSDWKMLPVGKDAAVIMYNLTIKGTFKGQEIPPGPYRTSAAWVNREGKWLAVYYQQTPVNTAPPPASTVASPPAQASASPAATVAEAGPDPVANEKAVWDTFKKRNYDAFAAFLAPEFVEVEAEAVYDKAGSVKSAGMFDASKAMLSDWKTVKLNNDALLSTYVVKFPGAPQQRHSSIWINRNGKWTALFHQGTPEAPPPKPAAKATAAATKP